MKISKKFLLLIISILILCLIFIGINIYAKYLSSASGSASMSVASWNIKVNNLSIKSNSDISNSITPTFYDNSNIAKGIIAPTSEGYFDLNFDFSQVDVSFKYEITTSVNSNSPVKDLVATGYSINDGPKINFAHFNEPISDSILLGSNIKNRKIRIYILWNDDVNTQTMTNIQDAQSTQSQSPALFDVKISFKQIIN